MDARGCSRVTAHGCFDTCSTPFDRPSSVDGCHVTSPYVGFRMCFPEASDSETKPSKLYGNFVSPNTVSVPFAGQPTQAPYVGLRILLDVTGHATHAPAIACGSPPGLSTLFNRMSMPSSSKMSSPTTVPEPFREYAKLCSKVTSRMQYMRPSGIGQGLLIFARLIYVLFYGGTSKLVVMRNIASCVARKGNGLSYDTMPVTAADTIIAPTKDDGKPTTHEDVLIRRNTGSSVDQRKNTYVREAENVITHSAILHTQTSTT